MSAGSATSSASTSTMGTGEDESPEEVAAGAETTIPVTAMGSGAGWSSTGPQSVSGQVNYSDWGLPDIVPAKKRDPYLDQLWAQEESSKAAIRESYSIPRLKQITQSAAAWYGVPASWIWGILQGESNYHPVGIFKGYKGSADGAKKARSTAYGMGQMLKGRANYEYLHWMESSAGMARPHHTFLDPKWGIWSVAASYGRMAKNRGGGVNRDLAKQQRAVGRMARGEKSPSHQKSLAVGHWWAGQTSGAANGAKKKTRQILKYGRQVFKDGKVSPSSAWQKMNPKVREADYLPPWKTGKMSDINKFLMMAAVGSLEWAGEPLYDLNAGLV